MFFLKAMREILSLFVVALQESLRATKKETEEAVVREKKLKEEVKELKEKLAQLEEAKRKDETELREQLEECKMKVGVGSEVRCPGA